MEPLNLETAREDLQYIRRTLEAAGQFTAVPGKGLMATGLVALAGVAINYLVTGPPWGPGPFPASPWMFGATSWASRWLFAPTESIASRCSCARRFRPLWFVNCYGVSARRFLWGAFSRAWPYIRGTWNGSRLSGSAAMERRW